jgi:hypothetical protein
MKQDDPKKSLDLMMDMVRSDVERKKERESWQIIKGKVSC